MNSERSDPLAPPDRPEQTPPLSRRQADQVAQAHSCKTDRELAALLPTLSVEERIVVILAKYVGGAMSKHMDGENNSRVMAERIAVDLFQKLKPWLDVAVPARAHHQQDEETKDVMARSGTTEIRDRQPAAVTDAGKQKDCAEPGQSE